MFEHCSKISGFAGPRYDDDGNVVAHSILGSYDDFQTEAVKRGDLLVSTFPKCQSKKRKTNGALSDNRSYFLFGWLLETGFTVLCDRILKLLKQTFDSLPAIGQICCLLKTFANSLDPFCQV